MLDAYGSVAQAPCQTMIPDSLVETAALPARVAPGLLIHKSYVVGVEAELMVIESPALILTF